MKGTTVRWRFFKAILHSLLNGVDSLSAVEMCTGAKRAWVYCIASTRSSFSDCVASFVQVLLSRPLACDSTYAWFFSSSDGWCESVCMRVYGGQAVYFSFDPMPRPPPLTCFRVYMTMIDVPIVRDSDGRIVRIMIA
jgi:hypothetical protein